MYADIAVCLPLARTFIYKLTTPVETGCRVIVPFRKRDVEGFVVGFRKDPPPDLEVHDVRSVIDEGPLLRPDIFELCNWIANYYVSPIGEALKAALPPGIAAKHMDKHSPPRRAVEGSAGVVSSAELSCRSDHPVCADASLAASTRSLRGGECLALTPDQAKAL